MSLLNVLSILAGVALVTYAALLVVLNKIHLTPLFFDHKKKNRPRLISGYIPYLGVVADFSKNPYEYIQSLREKYKEDIFTIYVMGRFMTFVCHPKDISSIFSSPKNFEMHELAVILSEKLFGLSKETSHMEDLTHASNKLITKHLQNDDLPLLTARAQMKLESCLVSDTTPKDADGWREAPLSKFAAKLISDASTFALFGDGLPYDQVLEFFTNFDAHMLLLASELPDVLKKKAFEDRKRYNDLFKAPLHEEACPLVKERAVLYEEVNEDDAAAAQMVLNWLSLVNTTIATFWAMYFLMKLPPKYSQEIIEEAQSVLKEVDHLKSTDALLPPLSHELLNKMPKLDSLIDETLRVSSLSFVARRASDNLKFVDHKGNVFKLFKEENIMLVPSHNDPEIFENPSEFQPYRFLNKAEQKWSKDGDRIKLSGAFVVFGGGVHQCPGRFFAKNEMKLIACILLQVLEFQLVSTEEPVLDEKKAGLLFMSSKNDVTIKYRFKK